MSGGSSGGSGGGSGGSRGGSGGGSYDGSGGSHKSGARISGGASGNAANAANDVLIVTDGGPTNRTANNAGGTPAGTGSAPSQAKNPNRLLAVERGDEHGKQRNKGSSSETDALLSGKEPETKPVFGGGRR